MIRVRLSEAQRVELRRQTREPGVDARQRDRLEMVRLSASGQSPPAIARLLGYHPQTVREQLQAFLAGGFAALRDAPRSGRPPTVTTAQLDALERLLDETARTWTAPQLAGWLWTTSQVRVTPDHLRVLLKRRRFRWKRTKRSVAHKQRDPEAVAQMERELAALAGQAQAGELDLVFLDEAGFAPSLPTGYTWARVGERKVVPYESPEGRRVNVAGAYAPYDPAGPRLSFASRRKEDGRYDAAAHLRFVREQVAGMPADAPPDYRLPRPCVIVLDNYSVHRSRVVTEQTEALAAAGIRFHFLPPYCPELNAMEPQWRQTKYQDLPDRSYATSLALQAAIDAALTDRAARLRQSQPNFARCA